jgi:hypothetical protein
MGQRSHHRIRKIEQLVAVARQERHDRLKQSATVLRSQARHHAIAVAAIVLSGQPRIDEPLTRAWARALQHYGIDLQDYIANPERLSPIIMQGELASARFTKIFKTAPIWLLQFTAVAMDARLLKFDLPDISSTLKWGSAGFEDARRWPLLPLGTMTAGDPIPDLDERRLWIILAYMMTSGDLSQFEYDLPPVTEEIRSHHDGKLGLVDDMMLALDLDGKPEEEWSRYEKRRMRKLSEQISLLERCPYRTGWQIAEWLSKNTKR